MGEGCSLDNIYTEQTFDNAKKEDVCNVKKLTPGLSPVESAFGFLGNYRVKISGERFPEKSLSEVLPSG